MTKRKDRKSALRALVRGEDIRTQKELVERLQARGFDCTQATVSRDIAELGLVKSEKGFYALPEDMALKRLVREHVLSAESACNLVVVKTRGGSASMVSEALDNADMDGKVGTIAGDNTIMLIAKDEERAISITACLTEMTK